MWSLEIDLNCAYDCPKLMICQSIRNRREIKPGRRFVYGLKYVPGPRINSTEDKYKEGRNGL